MTPDDGKALFYVFIVIPIGFITFCFIINKIAKRDYENIMKKKFGDNWKDWVE